MLNTIILDACFNFLLFNIYRLRRVFNAKIYNMRILAFIFYGFKLEYIYDTVCIQ